MTAPNPAEDLQVIVPEAGEVDIGGVRCTVARLRARQFIALTSVFTKGLGPHLAGVRLTGDNAAELQAQIFGLFVVAIPGAVDEFLGFIGSVVQPKMPGHREKLAEELADPQIDVLIDVFGVIAEQEADDLARLVGKTRLLLEHLRVIYQKRGSDGRSPEPST